MKIKIIGMIPDWLTFIYLLYAINTNKLIYSGNVEAIKVKNDFHFELSSPLVYLSTFYVFHTESIFVNMYLTAKVLQQNIHWIAQIQNSFIGCHNQIALLTKRII